MQNQNELIEIDNALDLDDFNIDKIIDLIRLRIQYNLNYTTVGENVLLVLKESFETKNTNNNTNQTSKLPENSPTIINIVNNILRKLSLQQNYSIVTYGSTFTSKFQNFHFFHCFL